MRWSGKGSTDYLNIIRLKKVDLSSFTLAFTELLFCLTWRSSESLISRLSSRVLFNVRLHVAGILCILYCYKQNKKRGSRIFTGVQSEVRWTRRPPRFQARIDKYSAILLCIPCLIAKIGTAEVLTCARTDVSYRNGTAFERMRHYHSAVVLSCNEFGSKHSVARTARLFDKRALSIDKLKVIKCERSIPSRVSYTS